MTIGHVLRIYTVLTNPPKEKIVLQVKTAQAEAPEIVHECHLDCGRPTVFSARELANARDCGRASDDFLRRVIAEVETQATTVAPVHRQAIVAALRQAVEDDEQKAD